MLSGYVLLLRFFLALLPLTLRLRALLREGNRGGRFESFCRARSAQCGLPPELMSLSSLIAATTRAQMA